ncbi:hypothetical protein J2X72_001107 [Phyllobacterium sp. 1468]|nr:hypothetical protein [Phyllobacterium sp. 1468]
MVDLPLNDMYKSERSLLRLVLLLNLNMWNGIFWSIADRKALSTLPVK